MPNKLIDETSPYLLQHAGNPVDWYPWGDEALQKARTENKPIFLSIGYAACHWCHVMEHESFEDPSIAAILNQHFVSIKVDREERPDLDGIYMNAVVAMTGQGGWPMSVFLTPQGEPFYGGTYFPSTQRYGMPAFRDLLEAIASAWQNEHEEIRQTGQKMAQELAHSTRLNPPTTSLMRPAALDQAAQALIDSYDWQQGGWGKAPRFPQPMVIEFLLMQATHSKDTSEQAQQVVSHILSTMAKGGLYDVVGGGFHRYSTDDAWLVPHFEKMLYDNAQLALVYLHAYQLTGELSFRQVCQETLDFIIREMSSPQGGFYSSLDADSEGEEGKYYVWTPEELDQVLVDAAERELFFQVYPVERAGNFEGHTILQRQATTEQLLEATHLSQDDLFARLASIHARLYHVREQRVRPATDDKVLVSWNAFALRAFAEAGQALQRPDYLAAACKNADFLLTKLYNGERLLRAWRNGQVRHNGFLEDYAALILGLLALYQADFNPRWYESAIHLAEDMIANFRDPAGGFFDTRSDHDQLITRPKEVQDNATPSGSALAASALLHLAAFDERVDWRAQAEGMIGLVQEYLVRHPTAFGYWLQALDFAVGPVQQVAIIGPENDPQVLAFREYISRAYRPRTVIAVASGALSSSAPALLADRPMQQGQPTVYVCQGFTCNLPVTQLEGLQQQLA